MCLHLGYMIAASESVHIFSFYLYLIIVCILSNLIGAPKWKTPFLPKTSLTQHFQLTPLVLRVQWQRKTILSLKYYTLNLQNIKHVERHIVFFEVENDFSILFLTIILFFRVKLCDFWTNFYSLVSALSILSIFNYLPL